MSEQDSTTTERQKTCSIDGCDKQLLAKKMCTMHYARFAKYGTTATPQKKTQAFIERTINTAEKKCVPWPFAMAKGDYGQITRWKFGPNGPKRVNLKVHRLVLLLTAGSPPTESHCAAHSCGNPKCINPNHLRWATHKENSADQIMHGTRTQGESIPWSKLTKTDVIAIRNDDRLATVIAADYGVSIANICAIRKRRTWKHVP